MVKTYKSSFMKLGVHNGVVLNIEPVPNTFFKPAEDESAFNCPHTLTVTFKSKEGMEFKQPFVNPSQDYGLFSDLCKLRGLEFGEDESEDVDEQKFKGVECAWLVEEVPNAKGKIYRNVTRVSAPGTNPENPNATEAEEEEAEVDMSEDIAQATSKKKAVKKSSPESFYDDDPVKTKKTVKEAEKVFRPKERIVDGAEEGEYMVPSDSIEGKMYTVKTKIKNGPICDCPGFASHQECKHANEVLIKKIL